jgi:large-conductance mechanosensitive channel
VTLQRPHPFIEHIEQAVVDVAAEAVIEAAVEAEVEALVEAVIEAGVKAVVETAVEAEDMAERVAGEAHVSRALPSAMH